MVHESYELLCKSPPHDVNHFRSNESNWIQHTIVRGCPFYKDLDWKAR